MGFFISEIFSGNKKAIIFSLVIFIITSFPAFYHLAKQIEENKIVKNYLIKNDLNNLPITKESAFKVADQVVKDFNVDEQTFKTLKMNNRPFLREDAGILLVSREGLCGEGSRVVIRLLNYLGFDATRITLYDKFIQSAHTLVSIQLKNEEFWVNSINSPLDVTLLLREENVSSQNFNYLDYSDNIDIRTSKVELYSSIEHSEEFNTHFGSYFMFSYEAIPSTKILSRIGLGVRVFNLRRPPNFISILAEEPHMILFLSFLFLSTIITYCFVWFYLKKLKKNR